MRFNRGFLVIIFAAMMAGLSVSFMTGMLIYFKQKPVLHHGTVFLAIALIFYAFYLWSQRGRKIPLHARAIALSIALLTGCLMPQFLYQVRPYTFYISGIAMAGIVILTLASRMVAGNSSAKKLIFMLIFVMAYTFGIFLSPAMLQIILFILSLSLTILFLMQTERVLKILPSAVMVIVALAYWQFSMPIRFFEQQKAYEDKIVFATTTQFHDLVITQWHHDHWFFVDGLKNLSSIDEYLYYEPMVHSVMKMVPEASNILVIGGENGCLVREVLKWEDVAMIDVVSYDTIIRNLGMESEYFVEMNQNALDHDEVHIVRRNLFTYLSNCEKKYVAIFIDLPDPRNIETNQYYTVEFYNLIPRLLAEDGVMITQAGSPYFATQAYTSIGETLRAAGFSALPLHNQILTLGEWGWYICSNSLIEDEIKSKLTSTVVYPIATRWFNDEAARLISSFGKTYFDTMDVGVNTLDNPLVYQYYLKGNWKLN